MSNTPTPKILHELRDPNHYPDASDEDMNIHEALVCEKMSWCGNGVRTLDSVIRTMTANLLSEWDFTVDPEQIKITIEVPMVPTRDVTTGQRTPINFANIVPHVLGMHAALGSHRPGNLRVRRGGDMGMHFDLFCNLPHDED